jgi:hypothetical protein
MTLMNNYLIFPQIRTASKKRTHLSLAKKVEVKVADFDIKEAVKLLSSDHSLASFNEDVAEEFKKTSLSRTFFPDAFKPGDFSLIVNEKLSIPFLSVLHQV